MGLLRTAARTAVITSTATRVHGRAAARQQGQWAAQQVTTTTPPAPPQPVAADQPAGPPPGAAAASDTATMITQLTQLGELRASGVLTEAEFEVQKARILHGS